MGKIEEWLSEYKNEKTRMLVEIRLKKFLDWFGKDSEDLAELSTKEVKHELLKFQKSMVDKGIPNNTVLAYISSVKNFMGSDAVNKAINFRKGQLVNPQEAEGFHIYSNGDLGSMFNVANVKYKALISLACSSGFSIAQLLELNEDFIKTHIERARMNNEKFVFIPQIRKKTNVKGLLVINPLAMEWLEKWIALNNKPQLFPIARKDAVSITLRKLAKQSQIKLTGKIRFHNIRAWTMSSLSKAGLNSFQIKFHLAKKIPSSDATYLRTLAEQIKERYETTDLYPKYMNILGYQTRTETTTITKLEHELEETQLIMKGMVKIYGDEMLKKAIEQLKPQLKTFKASDKKSAINAIKVNNIYELLREIGKHT